MKKVIAVSLVLLCVFGIMLIALSVKKAYAEQHYVSTMTTSNSQLYETKTFGCGKSECEYCNGEKQFFRVYKWKDNDRISTVIEFDPVYSRHKVTSDERKAFMGFVYYRTLFVLWVVMIVSTGSSGAVATMAGIMIALKRKKSRPSTEL